VIAAADLRAPDVVCIAASTGGPQAVGELLDALTVRPPCPVLVVQHMPESFTSRFAERLHRRSDLEVREAEAGAPLRAGQVLVAPGDAHLRIRHGRVRLSHEPPVGGLRPRADLTLSDLADGYGEGAMAVVLSGMGTDGFDGAVAVAEAGGQVLAQDAASCTVDGMPARIRAEGLADLVARPSELGAALDLAWRSGDRPARTRRSGDAAPGSTAQARAETAARGGSGRRDRTTDPDHATIDRIFVLLRRLESIDLRSFKPAQIDRNLRAFADQHGFELDQLSAELERHAELRASLLDRITINVTSFFRDRERWEELTRFVVPTLGPAPRVWNPGCADGSETCTLAMILLESGRQPEIWATDVNRARIDAARAGRYTDLAIAELEAHVGSDRRDRWFHARDDSWSVDAEVLGSIRFEQHDAVESPMDGPVRQPFDLVVCRNLIIYLSSEGRDRLLDRIAASLGDDGAVLLGNAERILRPERYGLVRVAPGLYRRGLAEAHR
jgi:two-component system CheB/CheR fusion protein